jgi:hypothetical protein
MADGSCYTEKLASGVSREDARRVLRTSARMGRVGRSLR